MTKLVIKLSAGDKRAIKALFTEAKKVQKEGKSVDLDLLAVVLKGYRLAPYFINEEGAEIKFMASKLMKG